jgi:transaldolase
MKATQTLHDLGQSLWLDNITRHLLRKSVLRHYIDELSVTRLTSNPTIFDHAIKNGKDYDDAIKSKLAEGRSGEKLFFELALEDLTLAADLFRSVYDRTCGIDGWVSLEVSPLLAHDTKSTIAEAKDLHARAQRPNLLRKVYLRSKRRSSPAYQSTSPCCSPTTSIWRLPMHSCEASNGASMRD